MLEVVGTTHKKPWANSYNDIRILGKQVSVLAKYLTYDTLNPVTLNRPPYLSLHTYAQSTPLLLIRHINYSKAITVQSISEPVHPIEFPGFSDDT